MATSEADLIVKHGLTEANTVSTPADLNVKLEKDDGVSKRVDPTTYQSIIGGLMYAATATRPDISYSVGMLSKFNSSPNEAHLTAAKRITYSLFEGNCQSRIEILQV